MEVENKSMTVADLIAVLLEMDPTMEVVTPIAPYGEPWPLAHGFVNVINIDAPDTEFKDLEGAYCGVGFRDEDEYRFTESDALAEEAIADAFPKEEVAEDPVVWHDTFVPETTEDVKNIINEIDTNTNEDTD